MGRTRKNKGYDENRIIDNRGERKTIHVSMRKRRLKPAVKNALIGSGLVLLVALVMLSVTIILKNMPQKENVVSDNSVNEAASDNQLVLDTDTILTDEENVSDTEDTFTEEDNEPVEEHEELKAENEFLTNATPSSFEINWDGMTNDSYLVCYTKVTDRMEDHGKNYTEDKTMAMADICTAYDEKSSDFYLTRTVSINNATITGLDPNSTYDVMVLDMDGAVVSENSVTTTSSGYCDPFKAVDSIFTFSERNEETGEVIERIDNRTVVMSSENGCLGTEARTMMTTPIYSDAELNTKLGEYTTGETVFIAPDENDNYCYLKDNGTYTVYVKSENGTEGWINARRLMVDSKHIYTPTNPIYGIQINRTNAYSSIFTTGGDAFAVDYNEDQTTRFNAIASSNQSEYMNATGYNIIEGITGEVLPNFGSTEQMPVVWDLAMELKQCQKNALENGYTLLIYEGYRPAATSKAVQGNLSYLGYLSIPINNTNLAQGYLTDQTYGVSFYIAKSSRHNRGVATDLTLMGFDSPEELGQEIRMQTKMHTLDYRCNMHYNNWQADLLTDIMIGHGSHLEYLAVRSEWWHFQLKTERKDLYPLVGEYTYMDFVF